LGIDLDLRTPPAFRRYYKENRIGKIVEATIEKYLDNGGLLLGIDYGLKAVVQPSDLGFDQNGQLKKPRDYQLGKTTDVLISYMNKYTAKINCSVSRTLLPLVFANISEGEKINAQIVFIDKYYKDPKHYDPDQYKQLTCNFYYDHHYFPVEIICDSKEVEHLMVGSPVKITITRCQREDCIISGRLDVD